MIERPERQLHDFVSAGADCVTFHVEADANAHRTLTAIQAAGALAGVALNPGTPAAAASVLADSADLLLCMSVNPGWGGQEFISAATTKLRQLRELAPASLLEVDGGIDADTAPGAAAAGATVFVAGSAVFGDRDPAGAYTRIAAAIGVR